MPSHAAREHHRPERDDRQPRLEFARAARRRACDDDEQAEEDERDALDELAHASGISANASRTRPARIKFASTPWTALAVRGE